MASKSGTTTFTAQEALQFHSRGKPGKLEVAATKPMATQHDLSLAYSPGVAIPVQAIADDPKLAYDYTCGRISMDEYLKKIRMVRAGQILKEMEGLELPEGWRFESEEAESRVFAEWQNEVISERKRMRLTGARKGYALGRKPEMPLEPDEPGEHHEY